MKEVWKEYEEEMMYSVSDGKMNEELEDEDDYDDYSDDDYFDDDEIDDSDDDGIFMGI